MHVSCGGKLKPLTKTDNLDSGRKKKTLMTPPKPHYFFCQKRYPSFATSSWLFSTWWAMEWRSHQIDLIPQPSECCFCPSQSCRRSVLSSHHLQDGDVWGFGERKTDWDHMLLCCRKYRISASCTFLSQTACGRLIVWCVTRIFLHFKAYSAYLYDHSPERAPEWPKRFCLRSSTHVGC